MENSPVYSTTSAQNPSQFPRSSPEQPPVQDPEQNSNASSVDSGRLLSAVFSDETADYRSPAEPDTGDTVTVRLRAAKNTVRRAILYFFGEPLGILMQKKCSPAATGSPAIAGFPASSSFSASSVSPAATGSPAASVSPAAAGSPAASVPPAVSAFPDNTESPSNPESFENSHSFQPSSFSRFSSVSAQPQNPSRFDYFEASFVCFRKEVRYCFLLETDRFSIVYDKTGARQTPVEEIPDEKYAFRFTPGFHVPEWAKGAVQYQIFTDRFRNGNPDNDVRDSEYYYVNGHSRHASWEETPDRAADIRTFFGGDLQGVTEKLDYLQSLGVEVLYFNPLFVSPSSHKYDIQDYEYIDPHFASIPDDLDAPMEDWEKHNGYARSYIRRVTFPENLEAANAYFARFCEELHRRGMKIILDGVFNHCGSFNKWMDREGIYLGKPGYEKGAYQDASSPYRGYFRFNAKGSARFADYEGWWGHETLPKLNYEDSPELREEILRIAEKWASPPYAIDGWRLDVAADLGHSPEYNHGFWREFRTRLKKINPDLLIIAEHYGDPSPWLRGDQWDTVMNYDAFMEPVSWFLTGMEKHSDDRRDDLYLNGPAFFDSLLRAMASFESPSLQCAMNELSNHDHSRFLTRTNRRIGRLENAGPAAAGEGIRPEVFRAAVVMQMTLPGAPTVYYGDEAGQVGWTDPDNRRTYPWGRENQSLIALHRDLTALRKQYSVLKYGSFKPLYAAYGVIAYARFDRTTALFIVVNPSDSPRIFSLRAGDAGVPDGTALTLLCQTNASGHTVFPASPIPPETATPVPPDTSAPSGTPVASDVEPTNTARSAASPVPGHITSAFPGVVHDGTVSLTVPAGTASIYGIA